MGMFVGDRDDDDDVDYSHWTKYSEPEKTSSKWEKYQKSDDDDRPLFARSEKKETEDD